MNFRKLLYFLLPLITGCAVTNRIDNSMVKLQFLDEYVLPAETTFQNTKVGGLSGIDRKNGKYYLVCDQSSNPRIYEADIPISDKQIDSVEITGMITVKKGKEFSSAVLDLESVKYDQLRDKFVITSEGSIDSGKDPGVYTLNHKGEIEEKFEIPSYFDAKGEQRPRNNGVFEGLAESYDNRGYWVADELPLEKDGPKPKIYPTHSHIRITKYDKNTGEPMKQFAYKLEGISKLPINFFAINGVTELLEYAPDKFLVLERAYSAGYGPHSNTVKIFQIDASEATNTLKMESLKKNKYEMPEKHLVFNFKSVRDQLTDGIIDNIEGMCFGPVLSNGKQSLLFVSDDNFSGFGHQITQFILFEIEYQK
ncbi:hypothetical protein C7S20_11540 [Christiangramia fulva]|uniref:Phytase-like domain-containing protein n=1 Tax=Christiangramia fulva TaxID=2126553 RepID=A0A2R3Z6K1_9FLAO|nr:esterase-like activity of phytase family protein [Christiangramia fulva]AVR45832.1 hypothetical protein C7S20_11540 [Christiangramia fulva]